MAVYLTREGTNQKLCRGSGDPATWALVFSVDAKIVPLIVYLCDECLDLVGGVAEARAKWNAQLLKP